MHEVRAEDPFERLSSHRHLRALYLASGSGQGRDMKDHWVVLIMVLTTLAFLALFVIVLIITNGKMEPAYP